MPASPSVVRVDLDGLNYSTTTPYVHHKQTRRKQSSPGAEQLRPRPKDRPRYLATAAQAVRCGGGAPAAHSSAAFMAFLMALRFMAAFMAIAFMAFFMAFNGH